MFALLLAFVPPLVVVAAEALVALAVAHARRRAAHRRDLGLLVPRRAAARPAARPRARRARCCCRWCRPRSRRSRTCVSRAFRSFLSLSLALPVIGLARLRRDGSAGRRRRGRRADVPVATPHSGRARGLRRVPGELADARGRVARRACGIRTSPVSRATRTWYPRATTVHDSTTHAVPAILTGQLPEPSRCRRCRITRTTSSRCSASGTRPRVSSR